MSGLAARRCRVGCRLSVVLVLLVACGGGGKQQEPEVSVTVTTAGGATTVPAGGTLVLEAHVANASEPGVNWSLTGSACPAACGTLTPTSTALATYAAPASVPASFTVTARAVSVADSTKSGSVTLTVQAACTGATPLLDGRYAILLQGFETAFGGGIAAVGSFAADGCGSVTGGEVDHYFPPGAIGTTTSLSGTYAISAADHRGTLQVTLGPVTKTFALAVGAIDSGVATRGALAEVDARGTGMVLHGWLWRQDPAAFTKAGVAGPYAFVLNGWIGGSLREAMGGVVTADGAGGLASGVLDRKAFRGPPTTGVAWTGTYATPSASGRSALTAPALTGDGGTGILYVVDAGRALALVHGPGSVLSGRLEAQHGTFGPGSLLGLANACQTASYDQVGYEGMTTSVLSHLWADGAGALTLQVADVTAGGNFSTVTDVPYTYEVGADGRAALYAAGGTPGGFWYLTDRSAGLMLGYDVGVSVGEIFPQGGDGFPTDVVAGTFWVGQAPGGALMSAVTSGSATSPGDGSLTTTLDVHTPDAVTLGQVRSGPLGLDTAGRGEDADFVYRIVSEDRFLAMSKTAEYPVVLVLER